MRTAPSLSFRILALAFVLVQTALSQEIKFKRLSTDDGLSINFVQCITQDRNGFMWFGTQDGLNRYDGYSVQVFRNNHDDSNSISNNIVNCLIEDRDGNIVIGSQDGGLDIFDQLHNKFTHYNNVKGKRSLSNNTVKCVMQDRDGLIWVGTENGLNSVDSKSGLVTNYFNETKDPHSIPGNRIYSLAQTSDGLIWIGTFEHGLCVFDKKTSRFKSFPVSSALNDGVSSSVKEYRQRIYTLHIAKNGKLYAGTDGGMGIFNPAEGKWEKFMLFGDPNAENNVLLNRIWDITEDKQGELWIASYSGGLIRYHTSGDYDIYTHNEKDIFSLKSDQLVCVYSDHEDNVWVGTQSEGINTYFRALNKFKHYKHNEFNPASLNNDHVFAMMTDHDDRLWVGTDGGGVNFYDRRTNKFSTEFNEKLRGLGITNLSVISLFEDSEQIVWLGTWGSGLVSYDTKTGKVKDYLSTASWGTAVTEIAEARDGAIWVSTYGDGIYRIDKSSGKVKQISDVSGLRSNNVFAIKIDSENNLWIGSEAGACKMNLSEAPVSFTYFEKNPGGKGLSSNTVYDIFEGEKGLFWFATANGLNVLDKRTGVVKTYYEKDGLPNSTIYGIMQDKSGNLWVTTNKGISRFNPTQLFNKNEKDTLNKLFRNYDKKDGLQGLEFNSGAFYVSPKGEMFVGGENGFNSFVSEDIKDNPHPPKVFISSFKRFGKEVFFDTAIVHKKFIELSYKDNFFSFEFVALDYLEPSKNKFSYKLEGVDEDWSSPSTVRYASYTQLEGGDYVFKVKASNNDGVWNEEPAVLLIRIVPPWWKTKWFYTLAVITGVAGLFGFIRFRTAAVKKENRILEQRVAERTYELAQKNKDITSSIEYAKRIQEALLPGKDLVFSRLPEAFILYRPKDIVSGDFYWFGEKNNLKIFAVVDCTGHGVPGALMSMIGHNLLNQIVLESGVTDPGAILNALNKGVQNALKQGSNVINTNDGMDVAMVCIDTDNSSIKFAGANRSLFITGNRGDTEKIESNKFPIGGAQLDTERNFTTHHKTLRKGDTIYMFTDGYADQFGGEKGKKFMVKRFHELLNSIYGLPMAEQGKILNDRIEEWRGRFDQVDDILVAGIRF